MTRRSRIIVGVLVFVLSLAILILGFMPLERIRRSQPISPSDLKLPTPTSLHFTPIVVS